MDKLDSKEGWEKVIPESDVILFENPGQEVTGIYKKKEEKIGQWKKNRYTLAVTENNELKCKYVYGTTGLDDLFKQVPIGYEVKIIFKKEIPQRPPRSPFKVFEMYKRPANYVNEQTSDATEYEDPDEKDPLTMNPNDDPKAREIISDITNSLINEKGIPANEIDDELIKKEAGVWSRKGTIEKEDFTAVMKQLERKHIKEGK